MLGQRYRCIGMRWSMKKLSVLLCLLLGWALPGWAQQSGSAAPCCDAIEQHLKDMEDRIILLEGQVRTLKEQLAQAPSTQPSQATATGAASGGETSGTAAAAAGASGAQATPTAVAEGGAQLPNYGGAGAAAKALNPDISAIGDFIGAAGHYPAPPGSSSASRLPVAQHARVRTRLPGDHRSLCARRLLHLLRRGRRDPRRGLRHLHRACPPGL